VSSYRVEEKDDDKKIESVENPAKNAGSDRELPTPRDGLRTANLRSTDI
jgi:hypothetical protein